MQKSALFPLLSFLLKVQFVRQLVSFQKMSVCNLLVAASPAFIQQESAAARNGRQLAFYQIMLTCFSVSVLAFSAAVPYN